MCLGQNLASVSSGQPGWRQGAGGFLGNGLHLPLTVFAAGPGDPFMFVTVFGYVDQGFMILTLWIAALISCPVFITGSFINSSKTTGYTFHGAPPL